MVRGEIQRCSVRVVACAMYSREAKRWPGWLRNKSPRAWVSLRRCTRAKEYGNLDDNTHFDRGRRVRSPGAFQ